MLYYEKLDVYCCAIELVAEALKICKKLPKGYSPLADQLQRAAFSVPLNIAEGVGKTKLADQARYHAIARGSAMECGAAIDVAALLIQEPSISAAKDLVKRIVMMLSKMCK